MCISVNVDNSEKDSDEKTFCGNVHAIHSQCKEYIMTHSIMEIDIKISKDMIGDMFKHLLKEFIQDGNTTMQMIYAKAHF